LLAGIALRARAGCRRAARVGAALAASVFAISSLAASARPDAFAVLLAGVALVRTTNRGRIDGVSALLFGLAPWIKPNVLGLALGAFAVDLASRRAKALPPLAVCATTSAALLVGFTAATHGAFLDHLSRSMGQPLSLVQWRAQIPGRLQFVGLPLAVAACAGYLSRRDAGARLALGALVSSFGWALLSLAKIGSSACYWMEACVAGVVLVSRCPLPAFAGVSGLAVAVVALVQALWIEVATVRSAREAMSRDVPDESGILASARATCRADAGDVLLADDVGVELELDARVVDEPFQMTHLVRAGTYPEALWLGDVERPQVVGVLVRNDLLERPASVESVEYDRLPPHVRAALRARFRLADRRGDWRLYCARTP
jgi:hypothetical protein